MVSAPTIAVISSVYGDYDPIQMPVKQSTECEFIMVTDKPIEDPGPWRVVVEPRPRVHPRLAARIAKCHPEYYTDADVTIWIDGNIEVTSPDFVKWCIDALGDDVICQGSLPREDAYQEVRLAESLGKWDGDPLREQVEYYVSKGYPADYGIWWGGFIVRTKDCPDFGDQWLAEMVRWTCEDQIAQSYIMYRLGIAPAELGVEFKELLWEFRSALCEDGSTGVALCRMGFKHKYFNLHVHPADI